MIGSRIHRARLAAGLSLRDVAEAAGVSHTAIAKYEAGENVPSSTTLLAIANACHVRLEYFLRPDSAVLDKVQYRTHASLGERALARIEAIILDEVERFRDLLEMFPTAPIRTFAVPDGVPERVDGFDLIEALANQIRDAWALGRDPIGDLVRLLEERGVLVLASQVPEEGFDGLAGRVGDLHVIVVDSRWPGDRQRFTLAHELGHLLLEGRLPPAIDEEKACNRFAGAFLVPAEAVRSELGASRHHLEPAELLVLKHEFGLSMAGWVHRARELGVLSEARATQLVRLFNERGWRTTEPGEPVRSEKPHLLEQLVFRALGEDLIGESKAAEVLGITLTEFRQRRVLERTDAAAHQ